jgi:hypothetical protein
VVKPVAPPVRKKRPAAKKVREPSSEHAASAAPSPSGAVDAPSAAVSDAVTDAASDDATGGSAADGATAPAANALPARGMIRYRVYRGSGGFQVGYSTHRWQIDGGAYRLTAVTETSGLAAFFKPLSIELESLGHVDAAGYRPDSFAIRRDGVATAERADFDWARSTVKIGDRAPEALAAGAQDLLSFHYQLAFLPPGEGERVLSIATGRKFERYRLVVLGDEQIDTPAGVFLTVHVRAPGDNTTELWLARERWLLPVKIRHIDRRGDSFEQLADVLETSSD